MPITYDSIFGAPTDEEKMRAAANRLRRREAFATLGAFSGDPVLGQWGRGEMGNLREQAQALRKARQEAVTPRPTGTPGYMYTPAKGVFPIEGYQAAQDAARQQKMELEMFKATQKARAAANKREQDMADRLAFERAKLEMPTRTQAAEARKTMAYLPEIESLATELQDIEIPTGAEVGAGAARSLPLSMGEAVAAGIERAGMTEEAVDWLARGRKFEQDIIRLASGLAVTGFELENVKKWSPYALGLTNRERTQRLQNIHNQLGREAAAIMNQEYTPISLSENTIQTPEGSATESEMTLPEGWTVREKK